MRDRATTCFFPGGWPHAQTPTQALRHGMQAQTSDSMIWIFYPCIVLNILHWPSGKYHFTKACSEQLDIIPHIIKNHIQECCHQQQKYISGLGNCQAHSNRHKFSRILIITWKQQANWQQILSDFFFEVTVLLHSFWERCLPNNQV